LLGIKIVSKISLRALRKTLRPLRETKGNRNRNGLTTEDAEKAQRAQCLMFNFQCSIFNFHLNCWIVKSHHII